MSLEPTPGTSAPSGSKTMRLTPQRNTVGRCRPLIFRTRFEPVFASRNPPKTGQTSPCPAAGTGRRSGWFRSPFGSDRRDPNTLAPNRSKLGRLRYARQGLVRVPESNTKYGGWGGITGVSAAPVIDPSISESSGLPKRKNCLGGCGFHLRPAVHRRGIFLAHGLAITRVP